MVLALVLLLAAAVAVLALYLRSTDTRPKRAPKPGEDLPPRDPTYLPDDDVVALRTMPAEEAHVVRGLLETSGIPVKLGGVDPITPYTRTPPRMYRVLVPRDRAEEADALLRDV